MVKDAIKIVIGIDLGDSHSQIAVIHRVTGEFEEMRVPTTMTALKRALEGYKGAIRTTIEAGTHSPWVSRLLEGLGHQVIVANPRMLRIIYADKCKSDLKDAEKLALLSDYNPNLLAPLKHRPAKVQADLSVLRARHTVVGSRTKLVNHVRGVLKSNGIRPPKSSTSAFTDKVRSLVPAELVPALNPLLEQIQSHTECIRGYDKQVIALSEKHAATTLLRQVNGVGYLTALAYVLIIEDPRRFKRGRDVGAYVGLVSRRFQSGNSDPELRISKAGDCLLRKLLVQSAHYILGPFGRDSDLRTWGLSLASRGQRNAKKRAVVAVARKLSVLLHRLWMTAAEYKPIRSPKEDVAGSGVPPQMAASSAAVAQTSV